DPEPVAAVDASTGRIWVAWTQKRGPRLLVRALHYDAAGTLSFDTLLIEVKTVPGLSHFGAGDDINMTLAAGTFQGQSHVAIAYADRYDPYEGGGLCPGTLDFRYNLADSTDMAQSWQVVELAHDTVWPQCVTDQPTYNRNRPAVAFGPGASLAFYVATTQSSPTGSIVHLYQVAWPFNQQSVHQMGTHPPEDGLRHDQFGPAIAVGFTTTDAANPG